ncbi:MAG: hypothetical protein IPP77_00490 [Bacteroidetes bacterium]|nr:hypothetical protein [Bacteroidota bacterium]
MNLENRIAVEILNLMALPEGTIIYDWNISTKGFDPMGQKTNATGYYKVFRTVMVSQPTGTSSGCFQRSKNVPRDGHVNPTGASIRSCQTKAATRSHQLRWAPGRKPQPFDTS